MSHPWSGIFGSFPAPATVIGRRRGPLTSRTRRRGRRGLPSLEHRRGPLDRCVASLQVGSHLVSLPEPEQHRALVPRGGLLVRAGRVPMPFGACAHLLPEYASRGRLANVVD